MGNSIGKASREASFDLITPSTPPVETGGSTVSGLETNVNSSSPPALYSGATADGSNFRFDRFGLGKKSRRNSQPSTANHKPSILKKSSTAPVSSPAPVSSGVLSKKEKLEEQELKDFFSAPTTSRKASEAVEAGDDDSQEVADFMSPDSIGKSTSSNKRPSAAKPPLVKSSTSMPPMGPSEIPPSFVRSRSAGLFDAKQEPESAARARYLYSVFTYVKELRNLGKVGIDLKALTELRDVLNWKKDCMEETIWDKVVTTVTPKNPREAPYDVRGIEQINFLLQEAYKKDHPTVIGDRLKCIDIFINALLVLLRNKSTESLDLKNYINEMTFWLDARKLLPNPKLTVQKIDADREKFLEGQRVIEGKKTHIDAIVDRCVRVNELLADPWVNPIIVKKDDDLMIHTETDIQDKDINGDREFKNIDDLIANYGKNRADYLTDAEIQWVKDEIKKLVEGEDLESVDWYKLTAAEKKEKTEVDADAELKAIKAYGERTERIKTEFSRGQKEEWKTNAIDKLFQDMKDSGWPEVMLDALKALKMTSLMKLPETKTKLLQDVPLAINERMFFKKVFILENAQGEANKRANSHTISNKKENALTFEDVEEIHGWISTYINDLILGSSSR